MAQKKIAVLLALLAGGCNSNHEGGSGVDCGVTASTVVASMVEAHGGMDRWQTLKSLYVEREHQFAGTERPIRFNIHGEYPSHRMIQHWQVPAGTIAWDGEQAWSNNWPLADQLMPRYVMSIGFFLVNMPWLAAQDANSVQVTRCDGELPGHADRRFVVVAVAYEPEPVRKPAWYTGPRDHYDLYIDPTTHRLAAIMQHWTYAARLDSAGLPATTDAISQLFVPETYLEVNGLLWPETYTAYTPEGDVAARGRFFDYDFAKPFDESALFPDAGEAVRPDRSSSYFRK